MTRTTAIALALNLISVVAVLPAAQEARVSSERLIKEAGTLVQQHRIDDAIARVKAAIAADPMSHSPWRAMEQVLSVERNDERTLKCWDDLKAMYPSNAFCLAFHAKTFYGHDKLDIGTFGAELQKARALAPANPFILWYSVQALSELGQYDAALREASTSTDAGDEGVKEAVSLYELMLLALNRQLHGSNVPERAWQMPSNYEVDLSILTQGQAWLMQLCAANLKTRHFILGGGAEPAFEPKRWKFGGSKENPFRYAPAFFIWDGSVIAVPQYGTLVVNGTHVKYLQTVNGITTARTGTVQDWRFVFEEEKK